MLSEAHPYQVSASDLAQIDHLNDSQKKVFLSQVDMRFFYPGQLSLEGKDSFNSLKSTSQTLKFSNAYEKIKDVNLEKIAHSEAVKETQRMLKDFGRNQYYSECKN